MSRQTAAEGVFGIDGINDKVRNTNNRAPGTVPVNVIQELQKLRVQRFHRVGRRHGVLLTREARRGWINREHTARITSQGHRSITIINQLSAQGRLAPSYKWHKLICADDEIPRHASRTSN